MRDVIAVLEDDQRRADAMKEEIQRLFPSARTLFFDNAPDMLEWLGNGLPSVRLLCLDHDLGPNRQRHGETFDPGIGWDVAEFLVTKKASCPVVIHSANAEGAYRMQFKLEDAGWSVERVAPFDDLTWIKARWSERVATFFR
jgi:hypothetical protein